MILARMVAMLVRVGVGLMNVIVTVVARGMRVRAGFGLERRLDQRELSAQSHDHALEHMVAPDAELLAHDLHLGMAITEMPGKAKKIERGCSLDLGQRLRLSGDRHDRAVIEHEPVAFSQRHRMIEIEQKFRAMLCGQHDPAAMPLVGIEHDAVDGAACVETTGRSNLRGSLHPLPEAKPSHSA